MVDKPMTVKPEKAIRIVLADASRLTTLGITQVLEKEADMEILAVVTDGEEAVAKTIELEPDVLIIEVDLPQLSGIKATQKVDRKSTRLNSSHRCISYAVFCLKKQRSGARGI